MQILQEQVKLLPCHMHWLNQVIFRKVASRIVTKGLCNLMYVCIEWRDGLNADVPWPFQHEEEPIVVVYIYIRRQC
jgi:hypothetical protein